MEKVEKAAASKEEPVAVPNHTEKIKSQVLAKIGKLPRFDRVEFRGTTAVNTASTSGSNSSRTRKSPYQLRPHRVVLLFDRFGDGRDYRKQSASGQMGFLGSIALPAPGHSLFARRSDGRPVAGAGVKFCSRHTPCAVRFVAGTLRVPLVRFGTRSVPTTLKLPKTEGSADDETGFHASWATTAGLRETSGRYDADGRQCPEQGPPAVHQHAYRHGRAGHGQLRSGAHLESVGEREGLARPDRRGPQADRSRQLWAVPAEKSARRFPARVLPPSLTAAQCVQCASQREEGRGP